MVAVEGAATIPGDKGGPTEKGRARPTQTDDDLNSLSFLGCVPNPVPSNGRSIQALLVYSCQAPKLKDRNIETEVDDAALPEGSTFAFRQSVARLQQASGADFPCSPSPHFATDQAPEPQCNSTVC
jgi:hypothetical protein